MFNLYVDTSDISLAPHLMMNGHWESWVTLAIGRHIKPGMRCVDVGSNCGYFSMLMAALGGNVTAFEPQPAMCSMGRLSAAVNGLDVRAHAVACSNVKGTAVLTLEWHSKGDSRIVEPNSAAEHTSATVSVATETLDDMCEGADFIKIDAEGHEPFVWEGMSRIIRECSPVVCMEFADKFYGDLGAGLLAKVRNSGYSVRLVGTDGGLTEPLSGLPGPGVHMLWLAR